MYKYIMYKYYKKNKYRIICILWIFESILIHYNNFRDIFWNPHCEFQHDNLHGSYDALPWHPVKAHKTTKTFAKFILKIIQNVFFVKQICDSCLNFFTTTWLKWDNKRLYDNGWKWRDVENSAKFTSCCSSYIAQITFIIWS